MNNLQMLKRVKEINKELEEIDQNKSIKIPELSKTYLGDNNYNHIVISLMCDGKFDPEDFLRGNRKDIELFKTLSDNFLKIYNYLKNKKEIDDRETKLRAEKYELTKKLGL